MHGPGLSLSKKHEAAALEATLLDPYELQARHDDDGALRGYLWYDINDAEAEFGVSSVDLWRTLTFETLD